MEADNTLTHPDIATLVTPLCPLGKEGDFILFP
jgi:hypothetical protein